MYERTPGRALVHRTAAGQLGQRRPADGFAAVYSSDLARAVETAELAYGGSGVALHADARLRECDYGSLTGCRVADLERVRLDHVDRPFPGGQSYREVVDAMAGVLRDLGRDHAGSACS